MDPGRWERVKAVYHSALDRDPGERAAFIEHACRDDREILREVESLLAEASGDSFLERPAWQEAGSKDGLSGPRESAGRHPFLWVVWLVLLGLTAAFGYAAWKLPRDVPAFGWTEERREGVWQVTRVDPAGPAAGELQPGDILLSLNDDTNLARSGTAPYRGLLDFGAIPHRWSLDIGASYRIQVMRAGAAQEYVLHMGRRRPDLAVRLSYFLIAFTWCAIGLFIGFARPQDALARLAFAAATLTGFVFLQVFNLRALVALQPLHVVLGYHFFYRFPGNPPRARGWRMLLWLLYLGTAGAAPYLVYRKWLMFERGPRAVALLQAIPLGHLLEWLVTVTAVMALLGAVVVAIHKYRVLTDTDQCRRFRWVALGGIVGLAPPALEVAAEFARQDSGVATWLLPGSAWVWFNCADKRL